MRVAIIGGGASAHLLAVLLTSKGHTVKILTSRPSRWNTELRLDVESSYMTGIIAGASSDSAQVLKDAQIAVFCMPVHQYPRALYNIMPALAMNRDCIVGTVYGQAGFDVMVRLAAEKFGCTVPRCFAIGLLPWIVRVEEYGKSSISYGPKLRNGIATSDAELFGYLQENILDDLSYNHWGCGRFEHVPNFVTLTLTVDNQIIHPSRCYALMQKVDAWKCQEDVPYFYRDWDEFSAEILKKIDSEYTLVRKSYFRLHPDLDNPYNLNYLELEHWSYGSHNPDIKSSFVNSTTLREIKPPVVQGGDGLWRLDADHRFFKDDFAYGLEICKQFARECDCPTPYIDMLLNWCEKEIKPRQCNFI